MIAAIIFVISFLMLLQFFSFYCHFVIAKSRLYELSEQAREIAGITAHTVCGDQFERLLQLISVCPEPGGDTMKVRAVSTYFTLLSMARVLFRGLLPEATRWIEAERGGCTYVVALALDRRIAYSRLLMAQHPVL